MTEQTFTPKIPLTFVIALAGCFCLVASAPMLAQEVNLEELEAQLKREQATEAARQADANRKAEAARRAAAAQGTLVIETDSACELRIDGESKATLKPGEVKTMRVPAGEQLIDCVSVELPDVKVREVREVQAGSKLVLTLSLAAQVDRQQAKASQAALATQIDREDETHQASWLVGKEVGAGLRKIATLVDGRSVLAGMEDKLFARQPRMSEAEAATARQEFDSLSKSSAEQSVYWSNVADTGTNFSQPEARKFGYMVGLQIGGSLQQIRNDIDLTIVRTSLIDALAGAAPLFSADEQAEIQKRFAERLQARRAAEKGGLAERNRTEGSAFLSRNKTAQGVHQTASGLQYQVLKQGSGSRPRASDTVQVHYTGTLLDGTKFDSSVDRGQPAQFALNQVIAGWTEALQLMPTGSKYRLWIPSELAYGSNGTPGPIGPNATVVFDVELLSIK